MFFKTRLSRIVPSVKRAVTGKPTREQTSAAPRKKLGSAVKLTLQKHKKLSHTGSFGWDLSNEENLLVSRDLSYIRIRNRQPGLQTENDLCNETHPEDILTVQEINRPRFARKEGFSILNIDC